MSSHRGTPIVVSAPSGAGKTTLCHRVRAGLGQIAFSISHTTRPPRPGERDGVDYHFVTDAAFDALVAEDAFLEWAHVHGRRYGTARAQAEAHLAAGTDVFFDIDLQGGAQIAARLPGVLRVFILPPSLSALAARLRGRGTDSPEQIERRLAAAAQEMADAADYTHFIVNDALEAATRALESIVIAERLRGVDYAPLLARVLAG